MFHLFFVNAQSKKRSFREAKGRIMFICLLSLVTFQQNLGMWLPDYSVLQRLRI